MKLKADIKEENEQLVLQINELRENNNTLTLYVNQMQTKMRELDDLAKHYEKTINVFSGRLLESEQKLGHFISEQNSEINRRND